MENFPSKDPSTNYQKEKTAGPSRSALCATQKPNLIFNPQPKTTRMIPSKLSGETDHGHTAASYWKLRTAKLSSQAPRAVAQIFAGLSFYFNGRTGDKQTMHLKGAVSKYGGRTTPFFSVKGVTHVIAENLSAVKTDKAMKSSTTKVVHPDWILRCMAEKRLLPDAPFRVVRSQKLGVDHFFSAGDTTAANRNPSDAAPRCSPSTTRGRARTPTKMPLAAPGCARTSSKEPSVTPGRVVESDDTRQSTTGFQDGCTPPLSSERSSPTERAGTCTARKPRDSGRGKVGSSAQGDVNQRSGSRKRQEVDDGIRSDKGSGARHAKSREDRHEYRVPRSVPDSSRRVVTGPSEVGARASSPLHQSRRTKRKLEHVSSLPQCRPSGEGQTTGEPETKSTGDSDLPARRQCMDHALPAMVDLTTC